MPARVDPSSVVAGIHAVEALLANSPALVNHIIFQRDANNPKLHQLQKLAKERSLRTQQVPKAQLDGLFRGPHQGVVAFRNGRELDDWPAVRARLAAAADRGEEPLVVVPAAMEDPRNFGACLRSAAGLGVDAVLFHNRGGCGLTPNATKAAAGAAEVLSISQVSDIEGELKGLRDAGFTIIGLEAEGPVPIHEQKFSGPLALVVGGEDRGIPPHIARACHGLVHIPMAGRAHSYNASVALSLLLYEVNRQEGFRRLAQPTA